MDNQQDTNRLVWQAENEYPELMSALKESLRAVKDPEIGLDVIQLGLVRDVTMDGEKTEIKVILTTPYCPYAPVIIESIRRQAQQSLDKEVTIDMGIEPWDPTMMEEGLANDWGLF